MKEAFFNTVDIQTHAEPYGEYMLAKYRCWGCGHRSRQKMYSEDVAIRGPIDAISKSQCVPDKSCMCWKCLMRRGKQHRRIRGQRT